MQQVRPPDLPDYGNPPVIEVVFGVTFSGLEHSLAAPHLGLFWNKIHDQYPKVEERPPIEQLPEAEPDGTVMGTITFSALPPMRRAFFIDATGNWVVQLQHDRLLVNWRLVKDGDAYPHFEACYERFMKAWGDFLAFCQSESLPRPEPKQYELTYINHIPLHVGWEKVATLHTVLPDLAWRTEGRYLPEPEGISWTAVFPMKQLGGRLHIQVRHARRTIDQVPVLLCDLTTRGRPNSLPGLEDWFLAARETIVRGFADITSDAVQKNNWKLK